VDAVEVMRTAYVAHKDDNDFKPGTLQRQVISPTAARDHLLANIVRYLGQEVERFIQERAVKSSLYPIDPTLERE
jgi:catalase